MSIVNPAAPRISAIIPAFNAAACITAAIDSALAQTYPPTEILVVDDGSGDDTAGVVSQYPPPVRLIRQTNSGPGAARNRAAQEATGEWLAFLDADDTWLPEKLEKQLPLTQSERVAIVHCRDRSHWCVGRNIDFDTLWRRNAIVLSTALVRRTAFEQVAGFTRRRELDGVEDYNLWLRILAAGWEVATCPENLYRYTPAPGNLSSQTERFARAELANLEEIGQLVRLDRARYDSKRVAILEAYGRELMYFRKMHAARPMLRAALKIHGNYRRTAWWLATFLPVPILDWRRRLFSSQ